MRGVALRSPSSRGLAGLLAASAAALSANRLLAIALPWFVLTTTGSAGQTGMVVFCQLGPYVVSQALSGPWIDRLGPRRISIAGDLMSAGAMTIAPVLYLLSALPIPALMILVAVVGIADGPSNAAKSVFVPSLSRAAGVPLERGTGLSGAVERTATTVGPAIAGVVVASFGSVYALWVAAGLCALSAALLARLVADPKLPDESAQEVSGYAARLRQGARFLRGDSLLLAIATMVAVTNLFDQAFMAVLLPLWTRAHGFGPEIVGVCVSVFGVTSVVASLVAAVIGERLPRRSAYLVGFVIGGVPRFVAMGLDLPLWTVLAVFAVGGLGSGFINPIVGAIVYERIPVELLGRVRTLTQAIGWAGIPFGGLVGAGLIGLAGLTGALWLVGGCYLVAIVVPGLRIPSLAAEQSRGGRGPASSTRDPAHRSPQTSGVAKT